MKLLTLISLLLVITSCSNDNTGRRCYTTSTETCTSSPCIYMVSLDSCGYGGNLGGVSGADNICANLLPSGVSSAKALLLTSGRVPPSTDWVFAASTTYFKPDGTTIGSTDADAELQFPLTTAFENGGQVWTGATSSWTVSANNCSDWSSSSSGTSGQVGSTSATSSDAISITTQTCDSSTVDLACVAN